MLQCIALQQLQMSHRNNRNKKTGWNVCIC